MAGTVLTMAGTRLNATHHPAAKTTLATSAQLRRQPRRTCSTSKEHPEELKKERVPRPVLLPVQEHLLVRSDKGKTGYKGVGASYGRYLPLL